MHIPLDSKVKELHWMPFTISYVIRKMQQIDNLNELPKEKRPTDEMIWDGTSDELDEWLEKVLGGKQDKDVQFLVRETEIEN